MRRFLPSSSNFTRSRASIFKNTSNRNINTSHAKNMWLTHTSRRKTIIYINLTTQTPTSLNTTDSIFRIEGVIGDWAGSILDAGSLGPIYAFIEAFALRGINITPEEARLPMGNNKDVHIEMILKMKRIRELWDSKFGRDYNKQDVMDIYKDMARIQIQILNKHSTLIKGADKFSEYLRTKDIKFGATTGYTKEISDVVHKNAINQGLLIDCVVSGNQVKNGSRPNPFMLFRCMEEMNLSNSSRILKFDDTKVGIGEGLNAGCYTVGVAKTSSHAGYDSIEHINSASKDEIKQRTYDAAMILLESGAHFVVDDINDIPEVIELIETEKQLVMKEPNVQYKKRELFQ